MKVIYIKEKVSVDVVRVTTLDERFYHVPILNRFFPSSTWISSYIKKDIGFYKWLADKGWKEAEAIKMEAGNKGSKVHQAIHDYVQGKTIAIDARYMNHMTDNLEELTPDEYDAILSFHRWYTEEKPKVLQTEQVVLNQTVGYAGTLDLIVEMRGQKWIVDIKTSKEIYLDHELQLSSYLHTFDNLGEYKIAILQVGYAKNKKEYKFTELEDQFELFLAAMKFWKRDNPDTKPFQKDYPVSIRKFDAPPDLGVLLTETPAPVVYETTKLAPYQSLFAETVAETVAGAQGARQSGPTEGTTAKLPPKKEKASK